MIISRKRHHEVVDGYEKQIAALRLDAEELEEKNRMLRLQRNLALLRVEDAEEAAAISEAAVVEAKRAGDAAVEVALKAYEKATS